MLEKGIRIVVFTLGSASDGVFLCTKGGSSFMRIGLERIKLRGPCGQFYKIVTSSSHPHWFGTTDLERDSHLFVVYFPSISCDRVAHRGWWLLGWWEACFYLCRFKFYAECGIWNCSSQSCCWGRDVLTAFSLATIIGMCSHIAFTIISLNDVWKFVLYEVDNEIGFYFAGYWYPHWNIFSLVDELGVKPFTNWTRSWQNSWEGLSPAFFYLLVWWRFDMQIFSKNSNSIDLLISICS